MYLLPNPSSQDIRAGRPIKSNPANPLLQGPEKPPMVYQLGRIVSLFCGFFAEFCGFCAESAMQSAGKLLVPMLAFRRTGVPSDCYFCAWFESSINRPLAEIHIWICFYFPGGWAPSGSTLRTRTKNQHFCSLADIHFFKNHDYNEAGSEAYLDVKDSCRFSRIFVISLRLDLYTRLHHSLLPPLNR